MPGWASKHERFPPHSLTTAVVTGQPDGQKTTTAKCSERPGLTAENCRRRSRFRLARALAVPGGFPKIGENRPPVVPLFRQSKSCDDGPRQRALSNIHTKNSRKIGQQSTLTEALFRMKNSAIIAPEQKTHELKPHPISHKSSFGVSRRILPLASSRQARSAFRPFTKLVLQSRCLRRNQNGLSPAA